MYMKIRFCERLKELREERGLSKEELAKAFFVSRTTIYHWEIGVQEPSLQTISDIADFFKVSTDFLLGRSDA